MKYSAATKGWYSDSRADAPDDCVEVSGERYAELMAAEQLGNVIAADASGYPILIMAEPTVEAVPAVISAKQGKLALLDAGLYDEIETYIGTLTGAAGTRARITWSAATTFRRDDLILNTIAADKGLTSADVDQIFLRAIQL